MTLPVFLLKKRGKRNRILPPDGLPSGGFCFFGKPGKGLLGKFSFFRKFPEGRFGELDFSRKVTKRGVLMLLFRLLEFSSQVQEQIVKRFKRRKPAKAFTRTGVDFENNISNILIG